MQLNFIKIGDLDGFNKVDLRRYLVEVVKNVLRNKHKNKIFKGYEY